MSLDIVLFVSIAFAVIGIILVFTHTVLVNRSSHWTIFAIDALSIAAIIVVIIALEILEQI